MSTVEPGPPVAAERGGGSTVLSGFGRPFGLARDREERLLVADMDVHGLCRLTPGLDGYQWLVGDEGWEPVRPVARGVLPQAEARAPARFDGPHSVAVGPDGTLFVVTYYTPGLHLVPPDGGPGRLLGAKDRAPALAGPATGHFDGGGRLLVTEYALNAVFAYGTDGTFLGALGGGRDGFGPETGFEAGSEPCWFHRPHMCRALADGELVVADTWNHRLQRFSATGEWHGQLGGGTGGWRGPEAATPEGTASAAFHAPVALSATPDGRFVVTDWGNDRLQWFDADGRWLATEDGLGLDRPYDAQVLGDVLAVANSHKGVVLLRPLQSSPARRR